MHIKKAINDFIQLRQQACQTRRKNCRHKKKTNKNRKRERESNFWNMDYMDDDVCAI